ncbi:MAG: carbon storage regulator [Oscillospiraceae bacterium]|nr:carbon storage regulator [Oscillospiraceae bacterium]
MLIISRKPGESFLIGQDIVVTVLEIDGKVRIGIDAPPDVTILRKEILDTKKENIHASKAVSDEQLKTIKKMIKNPK